MVIEDYRKSIMQAGKYVILVDDEEILQVFDTSEAAHEYASGRVKHTKTNKIDIYQTTGKPFKMIDGIMCRNDITPYQQHHIGLYW